MPERVTVELTEMQIEEVIAASARVDGASTLHRVLSADGSLTARFEALARNPRLSRSLLLGLLVFACFPPDGDGLAVTDVAELLDMNASTAHRYMATLLAAGLLEQDARSRRYRLAR